MTLRPIFSRDPLRPSDAVRFGRAGLWFDHVESDGQRVHISDLPKRALAPLTDPRPAVCGLQMDRPRVMAILNVTPDSFSDGAEVTTVAQALARARTLAEASDILDIGGESTRPGAQEVPVAEEIRRTVPVIKAIREAGMTIPISIDTRKAAVAEAALAAGATLVNDVSAFEFDPELADLVCEKNVPVCLMHAKGLPEHMQNDPRYADVLAEVFDHLAGRIAFARDRGIAKSQIIADPGIGFGKTLDHNLQILSHLAQFHALGVPLLLGVSRKRFIGEIGGVAEPKERMPGSVAVALHGANQGVQILRVHDAIETTQSLRLWQAMTREAE